MIPFTAFVLLISLDSAILVQDFTAPPPSPGEIIRTRSEATPAEHLDYHGHNRDWWRQRLESLRRERTQLFDQIAAAEDRIQTIPPNLSITQKRRKVAEISDEIKGYNEQIKEIERKIKKDLPEEARKAGAPPGWLR